MHKYERVVNILEQEIINGTYGDVKKLPTEEELVKKFKVSRNTIRKAIEMLVGKGYIYQVQGSGSFIRNSYKDGSIEINNMKGLSRDFPDKTVTTVPLEISEIEADENLAMKMNCEIGTNLYYIKRLRLLDNEPFSIEYSYFNKEIVPYINEEIARESIYQYVSNCLKLNIGFADKQICCRELTENEANLLELQKGNPALIVDNTVSLANGTVFDVSKVVFNFKMAKLNSPATYK